MQPLVRNIFKPIIYPFTQRKGQGVFKTDLKTGAYIARNGMRVNSDGTTILVRKPFIKLCTNHYRPRLRIINIIEHPERDRPKKEYKQHSLCPAVFSRGKRHGGESFAAFRKRRRVAHINRDIANQDRARSFR